MRFSVVSPTSIQKAESVAIIAAGPSLVSVEKHVRKWCNDNNALVIGAHYRYFVDPTYTVFTTPAKFRNAQGKIPGIYIVGPRILKKDIVKKYYSRIMRMKYTKTLLLDWDKDYFVESDGSVPQGGCGFESALIGSMCNPKKLLMAGFDGFQMIKGKLVVRHANKAMVKVKAKNSIESIRVCKVARDIALESRRKDMLYKIFDFFIRSSIQPFIFEKDQFRNIDKDRLRDMGVIVL